MISTQIWISFINNILIGNVKLFNKILILKRSTYKKSNWQKYEIIVKLSEEFGRNNLIEIYKLRSDSNFKKSYRKYICH